jgi:hypothetical protein
MRGSMRARVVEKQSLHVSKDKGRIECAGTIDISDTTLVLDEEDAQSVIERTLWI